MNTPFEKRICVTICICQMVAVLSCVSIVYFTVAVYKPAYLALNSGFHQNPVMCTTIQNIILKTEDCDIPDGKPNDENYKGWNSCSEWCLSKSPGLCQRIYVEVRNNGSNVKLEGCEDVETKICPGVDYSIPPIECVKGTCYGLDGLFNCTNPKRIPGTPSDSITLGTKCINLTAIQECRGPSALSEKRNSKVETKYCPKGIEECLNLNGTYQCDVGICTKLSTPYNCSKKCSGIPTRNKNVIIREGDKIWSARCQAGNYDLNGTAGIEFTIGHKSDEKILMIFCTNVYHSSSKGTFQMMDCFNATFLQDSNYFGESTDIVKLTNTHAKFVESTSGPWWDTTTDSTSIGIPTENELLIFPNSTRLYINFESCVNTLVLDECTKFYSTFGSDGSDLNTNSRFQCYYSPGFYDFVTLRFSRRQIMTHLIIAISVPLALSIVSCCTLAICSRVIHVGDDAHFYLRWCGNDTANFFMEQQQHQQHHHGHGHGKAEEAILPRAL